MNRRKVIGVMGAAATMSWISSARAEDHDAHHQMFDKCSEACSACQLACHACHHHCMGLLEEGKKEHALTAKLCSDCGDICALAANIVARHGALAGTICEACAKACDDCGNQCMKYENDPIMKRCADECKRCAAACREMMKHTTPSK
jgi:hypothetical protein